MAKRKPHPKEKKKRRNLPADRDAGITVHVFILPSSGIPRPRARGRFQQVVYEDEHVSSVDKPSRGRRHPAGKLCAERQSRGLLCNGEFGAFNNVLRPGIVHGRQRYHIRAHGGGREQKAAEETREQFRQRTVSAASHPLVHGRIKQGFHTSRIDLPIGGFCEPCRGSLQGQETCSYRIQVLWRTKGYSFLECASRTRGGPSDPGPSGFLGHPRSGRQPHGEDKEAAAVLGRCFFTHRLSFLHHPAASTRMSFHFDPSCRFRGSFRMFFPPGRDSQQGTGAGMSYMSDGALPN